MPDFDEALDAAEEVSILEDEIAELRKALVRTQTALKKAKVKEEAVVQAVYEAAHDATVALGGPKAPVRAPKVDKRLRSPHVALWHMTDWQGSKVTPSYNTQVMRDRVRMFTDKALYFTQEQRKSRPVRHCEIAFGGDMIEGLWNYPTQAWEVELEPIEQVVQVAALIAEVVRTALANHETVKVTAEWGNHGRIGSKRDGVPKETNLDRMAYILARKELESEILAGRLEFDISTDDIQRLEIGNYRALVIHGDEIGRMGYASPTTIVNHANRWRSSYPWDFLDIYVGHYHTPQELTLADGRGKVFFTGATESDNRYALVGMAATGVPSQRLHFVDPERGLVVQRVEVWLDEPIGSGSNGD